MMANRVHRCIVVAFVFLLAAVTKDAAATGPTIPVFASFPADTVRTAAAQQAQLMQPLPPMPPMPSMPPMPPPQVKTSVPSISHRAALLLSNMVARLAEPGDDIFQTKLMDPEARYLQTTVSTGQMGAAVVTGQVKAYRPVLFKKLRQAAGISEEEFSASLNFAEESLSCLSADSKSGQAFWVSKNCMVVVKTIKAYECRNLRRMMDSYAEHILFAANDAAAGGMDEGFGGTCISSVLGVYRITLKNGGRRYFMVSKNVYPAGSIQRRYDLKGSSVGRKAKPPSQVLKDLDLMTSSLTLSLGQRARKTLLRTLERDAVFLRSHGFMDYSLLVAVEPVGTTQPPEYQNRFDLTGVVSVLDRDKGKLVLAGGDGLIYHFGVIDFLQRYTFRKVLETFFKGFLDDATKISCVAPSVYARRLLSFIAKYTQ